MIINVKNAIFEVALGWDMYDCDEWQLYVNGSYLQAFDHCPTYAEVKAAANYFLSGRDSALKVGEFKNSPRLAPSKRA